MEVIEKLGAVKEHGQWLITVPDEDKEQLLKTLKYEGARLMTISGHDDETFIVTYHFDLSDEIVHVSVNLDRNKPSVKTIMHIYKNADLYEREIQEMFNIKITGRDAKPLFLSDDMVGKAPLRKTFPMD